MPKVSQTFMVRKSSIPNIFSVMKYGFFFVCIFVLLISFHAGAQSRRPAFTVIPLGTEGGLNESNLSAYMVAPFASDCFICVDAGTLYDGIVKANSYHVFKSSPVTVIRHNIKAYCISHPHLDHVAGLIINSPADTAKNIYGTKFCLDRISQHYFSWQTWANFGDEGEKPMLNKYHYKTITEDEEVAVEGTEMQITAFKLSHAAPYESTAFLLRKDSSYVLYFGDTGADSIEHSHCLQHVWQLISPMIKRNAMRGIMIEVSYPDEQKKTQLFGHLTPKLLMDELNNLATFCGAEPLKNLPLIITHMKPEGDNENKIRQQVKASNSLGFHIIFPMQGKQINL